MNKCPIVLMQKRIEHRLNALTLAVLALCVTIAAGYAVLIYFAAVAAHKL